MRRLLCIIGLGCCLVTGMTACRWGPSYEVTSFAPVRSSWDTLHVSVRFGARNLWGTVDPVRPVHLSLHVFNASFDTLYAGADTVIALPDAELGNRERLLVEACGDFEVQRVCEQQALFASPKRIRVQHDIDYPADEHYEKGTYALDFVVERQRFGEERWERIRRQAPLKGYLLAFVEKDQSSPVRVPFKGEKGRFDLARQERYRDFRYALQTRLFEDREAQVRFEIYADMVGMEAPLAAVEKRIVKKTDAERAAEVASFVEQAAGRLLDRLGLASYRRVYVFVDDWTYEPARGRYVIDLSLHWRRSWLRGWDELSGRLVVGEDGKGALFELLPEEGDRWETYLRGDTLSLDSLYVRPPGRSEGRGERAFSRQERLKTW